ncbi:MAG: glycosyltransferase family 4 protein [Thermosynechococcaceae cyanobacterium]
MTNQLGFLAGAPRISTDPNAEMSGPRSRVLGIIKGFEELGWTVKPFIVGDRVPKNWSAKGSSEAISRGFLRTLAVDIVRIGLGLTNTWKSWRELGDQTDWVYEYNATLQALGWIFKRNNRVWIFQTEALLFYEAKVERKALVLSQVAKWIELWAYRRCDVLACISDTLKEILITDFDIPADKIVLVQNGVDIDFINPSIHQPKRVFEGFTIGFVGSLYSWCGLDILIQTLSELHQEGLPISLVIVGDGAIEVDLKAMVNELELSKQVSFEGRVPWQEVPQYIAGIDIGYSGQVEIQNGKMYLSPMKLYEYMAMGKPVIASAFEDAKRLVQPGETGFLFQPSDKNDLKHSLKQAFSQKDSLPEMGRLARLEIEKNHSWKARVEALIEGTHKVLQQGQLPS